MTFDEWWKDSEKSVYWCNNPDIRSLCKCIAQSAWEASQLQSKERYINFQGKISSFYMSDGTFIAEEQKQEAICFLRDKCKESEDKSTILLALKGKGEI